MTHPRVYLDYNATAPLRPEARDAVVAALSLTGNPSSVHAEGRAARMLVEDAREKVAALVGAKPSEVVFTSGATEANTWAMAQGWQAAAVASHEHPSVLGAARASVGELIELPVDARGVVDLSPLRGETALHKATRALISVQLANSETGVIQPVGDAVAAAPEHCVAHTDATQAAGRIPLDMTTLGVDLLSLSAHKLGGPKGVGAIVVRDGLELSQLLRGGGQERRRRAGTENVPGIAGFGAAAEVAAGELSSAGRISALRDRLEEGVLKATPQAVVIGRDVPRLPNTSCIALAGRTAETLVIKLDLAGFAVSAGAACSSGKVGASHVLAAMGVANALARSAIRISLGPATTQDEIDAFVRAWLLAVSGAGAAVPAPPRETGPVRRMGDAGGMRGSRDRQARAARLPKVVTEGET